MKELTSEFQATTRQCKEGYHHMCDHRVMVRRENLAGKVLPCECDCHHPAGVEETGFPVPKYPEDMAAGGTYPSDRPSTELPKDPKHPEHAGDDVPDKMVDKKDPIKVVER